MALVKMLCILLVVVLGSFLHLIKGDTPANCTYEDVRGSWIFSVGDGGHTSKLDCTGFGKFGSRLGLPRS